MTKYIKNSGVWKTVDREYIKVNDVWKSAGNDGYIKVGGVWKSYKPMGPYSMSYKGVSGTLSGNTSTAFDIGTDYADRMVFVCVFSTNSTGVSIGGVNGTLVASETRFDYLQIWCVKSPPGFGSQNVSVLSVGTYKIAVYVLSGGAGFNPTFDTAASSSNNDNSITAYFANSVVVNDYILAIGCKFNGGSASFTGIGSNVTPETYSFSGISSSAGSMGASFFGPSTVAVTNPYINGTGSDISKSIQVCGIRIRKV